MLELHNGSGVVICPEMDRCVWCVFLKLLGPSPGPRGVGLPTRETGAAQVAPRRKAVGCGMTPARVNGKTTGTGTGTGR